MSASPTDTRLKTLFILFHQCCWDQQLSTGGPVSDAGICWLMCAWFSESTPAFLAHYLFIGLLWSCCVHAWWVECHFAYISREINLFFLAVTDFDHRLALAWILHGWMCKWISAWKKLVSSWGKAGGCSHWLNIKTNVLLCNSSFISITVFCQKRRSSISNTLPKCIMFPGVSLNVWSVEATIFFAFICFRLFAVKYGCCIFRFDNLKINILSSPTSNHNALFWQERIGHNDPVCEFRRCSLGALPYFYCIRGQEIISITV